MKKRDDTEMRFEEAKEYIKQQLPFYLEGKGISTRKNFCCLNPEHPDTKPSMSYDPKRNKCHCFACNANYDIFDLIAIDYSLDDKGAFKKALELYGVTIDSDHAPTSSKPAIRPTASQKTAETPHTLPITAPSSTADSSTGDGRCRPGQRGAPTHRQHERPSHQSLLKYLR